MTSQMQRILVTFCLVLVLEAIAAVLARVLFFQFVTPAIRQYKISNRIERARHLPE